ncbi:hypothetical protein D3C71_1557650 [compost metagenome]
MLRVLLSANACVEPIASARAAPAPKSRRIFIVTSPKVLRPTNAEQRQRMCTAPPSRLTANSFEHQRSTDTSIINLATSATCSASDLKAARNDIRKPVTTPRRITLATPARTLHIKIMQPTKPLANAGKMRGFVPGWLDHARQLALPFFRLSVCLPARPFRPVWLLVRPRPTGGIAGCCQRHAQTAVRLLHPVR